MFVITECWYNIISDPSLASLSIQEKMGKTMRHAGVSVTVTSITDVLAFSLGAFTVRLPLSTRALIFSIY
jgi:Niemann-Pick C1 protein